MTMVSNYDMYTRFLKVSNTLNRLVKENILDRYDNIDYLTDKGEINFYVLGKIFDLKSIVDTNVQTYEHMFGADVKANKIKNSKPFSEHLYDNLLCMANNSRKLDKEYLRYFKFIYSYLGINSNEILSNHIRYSWAEELVDKPYQDELLCW